MIRAIALIVVALGVTGCGMSRHSFVANQAKMQTDPAFLKRTIADCLIYANSEPLENQKRFAARHKIPLRDVAPVARKRFVNGLVQNRYTYEKYREGINAGKGFDFFQVADSL